MAVIRHADTWVELYQLGKRQPYRPTYSESITLGPTHRRLLEAPLKPGSVVIDIGLPGSLRREDAAKLYELAYFGQGDVLVMGLGHGLSAAIIAQAICDAGREGKVVGVDDDQHTVARVRGNLAAYNFTDKAELVQEVPVSFVRTATGRRRRFGLVFVDHSTAYADVLAVCGLLPELIDAGGFVLFHDFNDRRNRDSANGAYGVYSGVGDGLQVPPFAFYGVFGCTGLYRQEGSDDGLPGRRSSPVFGRESSQ